MAVASRAAVISRLMTRAYLSDRLQLDMKRPELGLTIKELRDYLESENLHYEDLVAAADKMVAENEKKAS